MGDMTINASGIEETANRLVKLTEGFKFKRSIQTDFENIKNTSCTPNRDTKSETIVEVIGIGLNDSIPNVCINIVTKSDSGIMNMYNLVSGDDIIVSDNDLYLVMYRNQTFSEIVNLIRIKDGD